MVKMTYFEEYAIDAACETLDRTIAEADIGSPARQTGDFFPHHVNAKWSKRNEFGQHIAHGLPVLSVGAGMTASKIKLVAFFGVTTGCGSFGRYVSATRFTSG